MEFSTETSLQRLRAAEAPRVAADRAKISEILSPAKKEFITKTVNSFLKPEGSNILHGKQNFQGVTSEGYILAVRQTLDRKIGAFFIDASLPPQEMHTGIIQVPSFSEAEVKQAGNQIIFPPAELKEHYGNLSEQEVAKLPLTDRAIFDLYKKTGGFNVMLSSNGYPIEDPSSNILYTPTIGKDKNLYSLEPFLKKESVGAKVKNALRKVVHLKRSHS